jgi:hypothetical protein
MGLQQFDEVAAIVDVYSISSGDTPGTVTDIGQQREGAVRYDAITSVNTDSVSHNVSLYLWNVGVNHLLGTVTVPTGAGLGGVAPVDLLAALRPSDQKWLLVPPNWKLRFAFTTAVGAGATLELLAVGGIV